MTFVPASVLSILKQEMSILIQKLWLKPFTETGGEAGSAHKTTWKIGSYQGQCGFGSSPGMGQ
jgi:hypothetical protein